LRDNEPKIEYYHILGDFTRKSIDIARSQPATPNHYAYAIVGPADESDRKKCPIVDGTFNFPVFCNDAVEPKDVSPKFVLRLLAFLEMVYRLPQSDQAGRAFVWMCHETIQAKDMKRPPTHATFRSAPF
jgi:hypothetical protein